MAATDMAAHRAGIEAGMTGVLCRGEAHMPKTVRKLLGGGLRAQPGAGRNSVGDNPCAAKACHNFGAPCRLAGAEHAAG